MRAAVFTRPGGPEVLEVQERPTPDPGPNEILVSVRASALNRADLSQRDGNYPAPPGAPADILGMEFAGEVAGVGTEVVAGASVVPDAAVVVLDGAGSSATAAAGTPTDAVTASASAAAAVNRRIIELPRAFRNRCCRQLRQRRQRCDTNAIQDSFDRAGRSCG